MAFCGNCGLEVPEGMKFCPNCGTTVFDLNKVDQSTGEETDTINSPTEDWQPIPHRIPETWDRAMVIEPDPNQQRAKGVTAKRSVPWMIVAIVSLIMGIGSWFIPSDVVTWIVLALALAMGITSLCMKGKYRAISIISIVVSGGLIFLWLIQGIIYLRSPHDEEVINSAVVGQSYGSSNDSDNKSSSDESIFSTGGVDPQLKAALDEYEAFVDEYVEFMKKYQADPNNALGMISDYTSMLTRLAEFSEKINGYDTSKMSKADYAYYLDVLNRVEKKMLDVAY